MIRTDFTALFCILVPLPFILGAPVDDVLKQQQQQQISPGAYREDPYYWNYFNQGGRGLANKKMDSLAGDVFGLAKRFDSLSGNTFGNLRKRNFDEIDRTSFGAFVKKSLNQNGRPNFNQIIPSKSVRSFDEIDNSGFGAFVRK